jgi:hypothetical protein
MFESFATLKKAFKEHGCRQILVKKMAPNDNSKNQIYLGGDFTALNMLPFSVVTEDNSDRAGSIRARLTTHVKFAWITGAELKYNPVNLILYPKYPEVRLSGLLTHRAATKRISKLINSRDEGRLLYLGVTNSGGVIGYCSGVGEAVSEGYLDNEVSGDYETVGVFRKVSLSDNTSDHISIICYALAPIVSAGWIDSHRLDKAGESVACNAPNCGGYTLEASLGIIPNGISEPDYEGWEVKQYGVTQFSSKAAKAITLMTPEPDGGIYKSDGVNSFLERFGYPDSKKPDDRLNFGGVHKVGAIHARTSLKLALDGYDVSAPNKWEPSGAIQLRNDEVVAASWSFAGLLKHWQRKHAKAVYVRSLCQESPKRQYKYGAEVQLGIDTDFTKLLGALASGDIYYDPGIKLEGIASGKLRSKRRSQFRVKSTRLESLYKTMSDVNILNGIS